MWQNFLQKVKKVFFEYSALHTDSICVINILATPVTKRNIVDRTDEALGMVNTPHECWCSDRKSPYWEKIPQVPQDVLRTSMTMPNTLPSWLYQFWTLHTTFGPFQHLSGVKNAILPPNALLPEGGLFCIFWIGWKTVQRQCFRKWNLVLRTWGQRLFNE